MTTSRTQVTALPKPIDDVIATAIGRAHRDDPIKPRHGGPAGNARLTAWLGLALLVLSLLEAATLLSLHEFLNVHIFVGAFLLPVVLLKTATTGWRLVRYYTHKDEYVSSGPPPLLLRLLGPLVVFSGFAVLGTGITLIAVGPSSSMSQFTSLAGFGISLLTLHQASAILWAVVVSLHVLGRFVPALRITMPKRLVDMAGRGSEVPGRLSRGALLTVTLAMAVLAGVLLLHFGSTWINHQFMFHGGPAKFGPPGS